MSKNPQSEDDAQTSGSQEPQCYCPLGGVMDLLSRKYAIQVICVIGTLQPVRYSEIETMLDGVSSSTLSTRLHELASAELLVRDQYDTIPPQVEYTLTADGEKLCKLLEPVLRWVENRKPQ